MSNIEQYNPEIQLQNTIFEEKKESNLNLDNLIVIEFLEKNHPEILLELAKIDSKKANITKYTSEQIVKDHTRTLLKDFFPQNQFA